MDLVIWQCPECTFEVHQNVFGTPHTAGISCVECDVDMRVIDRDESEYEFEEEE